MRNTCCLALLSVLSTLAVSAGCARTAPMAAVPAPAPKPVAAAPQVAEKPVLVEEAPTFSESAAFTQKPGDYVVYKFSGAFHKVPIVLTQRVVEASDVLLVVDLTFEEGKQVNNVRAYYTHAPGAANELLKASRLDAGAEKPMPVAELDALMTRTTLAADDNHGAIGSEQVTVSVGGHDMACTQTRYRVTIGKHTATMRTLSSESFPWGDVGGDIVSDKGKVLYRAEVIEAGSASPLVAAAR